MYYNINDACIIYTLQVIVNGGSVVWVVVLSVFLIKTRYKLVHYIAMILCTVGMVVLFFEDSSNDKHTTTGQLAIQY